MKYNECSTDSSATLTFSKFIGQRERKSLQKGSALGAISFAKYAACGGTKMTGKKALDSVDNSDELRRLRAFHSLGELTHYSDPFFDVEIVSFTNQREKCDAAKFKSCHNRLCIVVNGEVRVDTETGTQEYTTGQLFMSAMEVPHQVICGPSQESMFLVVPIVPSLVNQLYPLIDLVAAGGQMPFEEKASLGSEIWHYLFKLNGTDDRLNGKRRSALRRIYMKAIYQYGFDRDTLLAHGVIADEIPDQMAQRVYALFDGKMRTSDVTRDLPVSSSVAHRKFQSKYGMSVKSYQRRLRAIRARQLYENSNTSFTEIARKLGCGSMKDLRGDVLSRV